LWNAIQRTPEPSLTKAVAAVVDKLPVAVSVDVSTIRVADTDGMLHLVASAGLTAAEVRARALDPVPLRTLAATTPEAAGWPGAPSGIRAVGLAWIGNRDAALGAVMVGSRTERHPSAAERDTLAAVADALANGCGSSSALLPCFVARRVQLVAQ
jgi:hypothetical protein